MFGAIIHALGDEKISEKLVIFFIVCPSLLLVCLLHISFDWFSYVIGFYSKDYLIETAFVSSTYGFSIFLLACFAAF